MDERDVKVYWAWSHSAEPKHCTAYFSSEGAPAWSGVLRSDNWGVLELVLGDMAYHDVSVWEIEATIATSGYDGLREVAKAYDETDAEDEIYEILLSFAQNRGRAACMVRDLFVQRAQART